MIRQLLIQFTIAVLIIPTGGCRKESANTAESPFSETATQLADAVNNNRVEALRQLLESGVNPDIVMLDGTTFLHSARPPARGPGPLGSALEIENSGC